MNTATVSPTHTLRDYREKEMEVFLAIPGMQDLLRADSTSIDEMREKHPDAVFALRTAENLFSHDKELSRIHQRAYFAILNGEDIPNVRFRFDKDMDAYLKRHNWD